MAINFKPIATIQDNYPFEIARIGDKFIVKESIYMKATHKSLTNNIEQIIEHIILGTSKEEHKTMQLFQYGDDGLFEVTWYLTRKITRDMPPFEVVDVKWTFVSKDLAAFEVLYGL